MRKGLILGALVVLFLVMVASIGVVAAVTTIYVPDNYAKIQWAVDNATDGDTIIVRDGTYVENVDVNKRLTIQSENGSESTVVQAEKSGDHVFDITANYVNISGFTIKGAKVRAGIYLNETRRCNITNNVLLNNQYGIKTSGIVYGFGEYVSWCNISDNILLNNTYGIWFYSGDHSVIRNNVISNSTNGLRLELSDYITIVNNNISLNKNDGIALLGCYGSNDNLIMSNNISLNKNDGIALTPGYYNAISENTISNNGKGIRLSDSSENNYIYYNNFIGNIVNAYSTSVKVNFWNVTRKRIMYYYDGRTYSNYLGNYWADYNDSDKDKDGIGDTYYSIDSGGDYYPLMDPCENYFVTPTSVGYFLDTGEPENPYPSIFGMHNGTITPKQTIIISKLYTYSCPGTGGHSEYAKIWNKSWNITARWKEYKGDWHNISFDNNFTLQADITYNYTFITGSYPQIIHEQNYRAIDGSLITCTEFIDANEKRYNNWIPAIKLIGTVIIRGPLNHPPRVETRGTGTGCGIPVADLFWHVSDTDLEDYITAYQVQIDNNSDFNHCPGADCLFDTGKETDLKNKNLVCFNSHYQYSLPGELKPKLPPAVYFWRVRVWDSQDTPSLWDKGTLDLT